MATVDEVAKLMGIIGCDRTQADALLQQNRTVEAAVGAYFDGAPAFPPLPDLDNANTTTDTVVGDSNTNTAGPTHGPHLPPPAIAKRRLSLETQTDHEAANQLLSLNSGVQHKVDASMPGGLQNIGNTCYLNSVLQACVMLPLFQQQVLEFTAQEEVSACPRVVFLYELQKLCARLLWDERQYQNPSAMVQALFDLPGAPFSPQGQQDALEFAQFFLDNVHKGLLHASAHVRELEISPAELRAGRGALNDAVAKATMALIASEKENAPAEPPNGAGTHTSGNDGNGSVGSIASATCDEQQQQQQPSIVLPTLSDTQGAQSEGQHLGQPEREPEGQFRGSAFTAASSLRSTTSNAAVSTVAAPAAPALPASVTVQQEGQQLDVSVSRNVNLPQTDGLAPKLPGNNPPDTKRGKTEDDGCWGDAASTSHTPTPGGSNASVFETIDITGEDPASATATQAPGQPAQPAQPPIPRIYPSKCCCVCQRIAKIEHDEDGSDGGSGGVRASGSAQVDGEEVAEEAASASMRSTATVTTKVSTSGGILSAQEAASTTDDMEEALVMLPREATPALPAPIKVSPSVCARDESGAVAERLPRTVISELRGMWCRVYESKSTGQELRRVQESFSFVSIPLKQGPVASASTCSLRQVLGEACLEPSEVTLESADGDTVAGLCRTYIEEAPSAMLLHFQRVQYDADQKKSHKVHIGVRAPARLYLDEFLLQNAGTPLMDTMLESVERGAQWESCSAMACSQQLSNALHTLDSLKACPEFKPLIEGVDEDTLAAIHGVLEANQKKVQESFLETQSKFVDAEAVLRDSLELNQAPYHLHAVLLHEGSASVGHYRVYVKAPDNRWISFNDTTVMSVAEQEVHAEAMGLTSSTRSAYLLMYVLENGPLHQPYTLTPEAHQRVQSSIEQDALPANLPTQQEIYNSLTAGIEGSMADTFSSNQPTTTQS
eukprot:m.288067 g.288067  ORF g.288067 m.288067 type:complete len:950 (+) comp15796_c0_seq1:274-3123(+)